jgi:hypothetical protein
MSPKMIPKKWSTYWQYFTQPAASIQGEERRQRASLLTALSAALLVVGIVIVIIWVWSNPDFVAAPFSTRHES